MRLFCLRDQKRLAKAQVRLAGTQPLQPFPRSGSQLLGLEQAAAVTAGCQGNLKVICRLSLLCSAELWATRCQLQVTNYD